MGAIEATALGGGGGTWLRIKNVTIIGPTLSRKKLVLENLARIDWTESVIQITQMIIKHQNQSQQLLQHPRRHTPRILHQQVALANHMGDHLKMEGQLLANNEK
jgi:hypothetical protein